MSWKEKALRERKEGPGSPKVEPVARRLAQPGSLDDLPIIDLEKKTEHETHRPRTTRPRSASSPRRLPPSNSIPSLSASRDLSETEECSKQPPPKKDERQRSHHKRQTRRGQERRTPSKHTLTSLPGLAAAEVIKLGHGHGVGGGGTWHGWRDGHGGCHHRRGAGTGRHVGLWGRWYRSRYIL